MINSKSIQSTVTKENDFLNTNINNNISSLYEYKIENYKQISFSSNGFNFIICTVCDIEIYDVVTFIKLNTFKITNNLVLNLGYLKSDNA